MKTTLILSSSLSRTLKGNLQAKKIKMQPRLLARSAWIVELAKTNSNLRPLVMILKWWGSYWAQTLSGRLFWLQRGLHPYPTAPQYLRNYLFRLLQITLQNATRSAAQRAISRLPRDLYNKGIKHYQVNQGKWTALPQCCPQRATQPIRRVGSRLMTMSPLYPCGKPCSRGTHNETVKNLALFCSIIDGIMMETRLRMSVPWECFQSFNRIENSITFTPSQ